MKSPERPQINPPGFIPTFGQGIYAKEIQKDVEGGKNWLKKQKLHKYWPIFSNWSYEDILSINEDNIDKMIEKTGATGMTEGAKCKMVRCVRNLRERENILLTLLTKLKKGLISIAEAIICLGNAIQSPLPITHVDNLPVLIVVVVIQVYGHIRNSRYPRWVKNKIESIIAELEDVPILHFTTNMLFLSLIIGEDCILCKSTVDQSEVDAARENKDLTEENKDVAQEKTALTLEKTQGKVDVAKEQRSFRTRVSTADSGFEDFDWYSPTPENESIWPEPENAVNFLQWPRSILFEETSTSSNYKDFILLPYEVQPVFSDEEYKSTPEARSTSPTNLISGTIDKTPHNESSSVSSIHKNGLNLTTLEAEPVFPDKVRWKSIPDVMVPTPENDSLGALAKNLFSNKLHDDMFDDWGKSKLQYTPKQKDFSYFEGNGLSPDAMCEPQEDFTSEPFLKTSFANPCKPYNDLFSKTQSNSHSKYTQKQKGCHYYTKYDLKRYESSPNGMGSSSQGNASPGAIPKTSFAGTYRPQNDLLSKLGEKSDTQERPDSNYFNLTVGSNKCFHTTTECSAKNYAVLKESTVNYWKNRYFHLNQLKTTIWQDNASHPSTYNNLTGNSGWKGNGLEGISLHKYNEIQNPHFNDAPTQAYVGMDYNIVENNPKLMSYEWFPSILSDSQRTNGLTRGQDRKMWKYNQYTYF